MILAINYYHLISSSFPEREREISKEVILYVIVLETIHIELRKIVSEVLQWTPDIKNPLKRNTRSRSMPILAPLPIPAYKKVPLSETPLVPLMLVISEIHCIQIFGF